MQQAWLINILDVISIRRAASVFRESNDPIFVDNLVCTSDENSLLDCPYNMLHQCDHSDDAGVQCFGKYKGKHKHSFFASCQLKS